LEDQNLSLIQNGQDMEENIEEIKNQAKVKIIKLIQKLFKKFKLRQEF